MQVSGCYYGEGCDFGLLRAIGESGCVITIPRGDGYFGQDHGFSGVQGSCLVLFCFSPRARVRAHADACLLVL